MITRVTTTTTVKSEMKVTSTLTMKMEMKMQTIEQCVV